MPGYPCDTLPLPRLVSCSASDIDLAQEEGQDQAELSC